MARKEYVPLDVNDTNLKRVKGPDPEFADPNDPEKAGSWWDFDLSRAKGARAALRPVVILSAVGFLAVLLSGIGQLSTAMVLQSGEVIPLDETASPQDLMLWFYAGALLNALQAGLFVYTAIGALMKSPASAWYGLLSVALLIVTHVTAILGIYGSIGIFTVLFVVAYGAATVAAIEAAQNLQKMRELGVDELPQEAPAGPPE